MLTACLFPKTKDKLLLSSLDEQNGQNLINRPLVMVPKEVQRINHLTDGELNRL